MRTHQEIDARSLALHRLVAGKIRRDPALFERAKETLARWRIMASPASQPYLHEWQRLIDQGLVAALALALEDSEHARTMRQCSPFAGILTDRERFAFLLSWDENHAPHGA